MFDASAMTGLFTGHPALYGMLEAATDGRLQILLPAVSIAEAEEHLTAGLGGWAIFFLSPNVQTLPLVEHAAVEIGSWPCSMNVRHAVHEARATRAAVVTRRPADYQGLEVSLLVV